MRQGLFPVAQCKVLQLQAQRRVANEKPVTLERNGEARLDLRPIAEDELLHFTDGEGRLVARIEHARNFIDRNHAVKIRAEPSSMTDERDEATKEKVSPLLPR